MQDEKIAIELKDVSMSFNMSVEKVNSIKEYFIKIFKKQIAYKKFNALKNVSIKIKQGEIVGIVGLNGSGKSTMLKIISGILKPTAGEVEVKGTISPLIELGAGFNGELTARENIFLNGAVLGYSTKFIKKNFDEIVEFSEMKDFLDVPMKNLSTGMVARIAFSIATIVNPDILIVDEILAVGDFLFQEKCEKRIKEIINNNTTVVIVSHDLDQIRKMCHKVIWLKKGEIEMVDEVEKVCDAYEKGWLIACYNFKEISWNFFKLHSKNVLILKEKLS